MKDISVMDYIDLSSRSAVRRKDMGPVLKYLLSRGKLKGKVLDYGCGYGTEVLMLRKMEINAYGYDPNFTYSAKSNPDNVLSSSIPTDLYDTIYCIGVLHHIPFKSTQLDILIEIFSLLNPGGAAYFFVPPHTSASSDNHVFENGYLDTRGVYYKNMNGDTLNNMALEATRLIGDGYIFTRNHPDWPSKKIVSYKKSLEKSKPIPAGSRSNGRSNASNSF